MTTKQSLPVVLHFKELSLLSHLRGWQLQITVYSNTLIFWIIKGEDLSICLQR
jgi:hypothetical protein